MVRRVAPRPLSAPMSLTVRASSSRVAVRTRDPHAERRGRDDDVECARHEALLHVVAHGPAQPRVVGGGADAAGGDRVGRRDRVLAGGAVDEPGTGQLTRALAHRPHALVGVGVQVPAQVQGGPVERGDHLAVLAQPEPIDDVRTHRWRRGGGQGDHRGTPQPVDRRTEPQVVRPEVVPPLGDAVRLVDDEQGR